LRVKGERQHSPLQDGRACTITLQGFCTDSPRLAASADKKNPCIGSWFQKELVVGQLWILSKRIPT